MSQNAYGRANQQTQNQPTKSPNQLQQNTFQNQYPVRTSNTTYEYRSNTRIVPVESSAYATQNLNRQSAGYPAVKNQIYGRANQNTSTNYIYQTQNQNQTRSSQVGRTYIYQPSSRREYIPNETNTRGHRGISMENSNAYQNTRMTYEIPRSNNIYVSGSGSPGFRRYIRNMEDESTYKSYIRGGIVKLRKWKYTTQTEINKIILIQRYWRYVHLKRIEQRQTLLSQSSEQKSDNESSNNISERERYNENERYGHINYTNNYTNEGYGNIFKTETKVKKNAREKIISGTKNRYIVETTTIEVFKNQNIAIKKVAPEILEKETKKIKRKGIKEQMIEIWNTENIPINNDTLTIYAEQDVNQYIQIIEEYEEQIKTMKSKITQYEEEIIELGKKLKTYEKKDWNQINREKKESRITIKKKELKLIDIITLVLKLRKPLQKKKESEVKIITPIRKGKKIICIEERDAITIKGKEIPMNQVEYIDEMFLEEEMKPENDIQVVDQMEIPRTEKEKVQWETIPSEECSIIILGQEKPKKPENVVEERDTIIIQAKEKEENQVEYIDEMFLEEEIKPENEIK